MILMMIINFVKFTWFLFAIIGINTSYAADARLNHYVVTQQQWAIPKKAQSILTIPALHDVMKTLSLQADSRLLVRYPRSDVGVLWASELKAWLVALGLASSRIELQLGSANENELRLFVD